MQHTSRTKGSRYIDPSGAEADTGTVIERAEYKLRQADLLLAYLRHQSKEIALAQRRASFVAEDGKLRLDTFFFASLEAARSAYFILKKAGPHWKRVLDQWKADPSAKDEVDRFDAMVTLRGQDVHHGCAPSEAMGTMIPIEDHGSGFGEHYNSAIFGPRVMTTYTNPDGTTVSGAHGLQGSMGLHVDLVGKRYEGSVACAAFIGQLRALIATAKAAPTAV
jgi:hypothetical protein